MHKLYIHTVKLIFKTIALKLRLSLLNLGKKSENENRIFKKSVNMVPIPLI